jgi:hypothetical protein
MRTLAITALLGTVLLTGCTGTTAVGHRYHLLRNASGHEVLGAIGEPGPSPCGALICPGAVYARVTNDPHDEEFWQFEARISVYANVGIPYGRQPRDYNVIGSRDRCEDERVHWIARSIPTEPCRGPFFFRRDPVAEAAQGSAGTLGSYGGNDEQQLSQLFLGRGGAGTFVGAPPSDNSWGTSPYTDLQVAQIVDFEQGLGLPARFTAPPSVNYAGAPDAHGVAGGPADFADQFDGASPEKFGRQNEDLLGRR